MSAQVIDAAFPTGDRADDTIRRTIDALTKGKGVRPDDVAEAAGMSRSAYFRKMAGHGSHQAFKAGEVAAIARFLGVGIEQLYGGLGGTFVPPDGGGAARTRWFEAFRVDEQRFTAATTELQPAA